MPTRRRAFEQQSPLPARNSFMAPHFAIKTGLVVQIHDGIPTRIEQMQALEEELDESLWGQLPMELLDMILLRLPLAKAMQFKILSKGCRDLLAQHSYYRKKFHIQFKRPWLFLSTSGQFSYALDFTLGVWHRIPNPPSYRETVLCTAGNLTCLGNVVAHCRALSLCDPIKKMIKRLPRMNKIQFIHKVSMTLRAGEAAFKIIVAGEEDRVIYGASSNCKQLLTEVYDSKTSVWTMSGKTLPEAKYGMDPGVWFQNKFFCIVEMPYGVVVFDAEKGVWEELETGMPAGCSSNIASPSLVECKGRLLMVVRVSSDGDSKKRIQIWELIRRKREKTVKKRNEHEWVMLEEHSAGAECMDSERLICCGVGERVCITSPSNRQPLAFSIATERWEWLPQYPGFAHHRNYSMLAFRLDPISPTLEISGS